MRDSGKAAELQWDDGAGLTGGIWEREERGSRCTSCSTDLDPDVRGPMMSTSCRLELFWRLHENGDSALFSGVTLGLSTGQLAVLARCWFWLSWRMVLIPHERRSNSLPLTT